MMEKLVTWGSSIHNKNKMNTGEMKTCYLKSRMQQIVFSRTSDKAEDRSIGNIQTKTEQQQQKSIIDMRNSVKKSKICM